jgi:hypothetical protein
MSSDAAKSAARTQADAANRAMSQELAMYERSREDLTPYRESGYTALKDIERMKPFLLGRFNQPYQYTSPPTQAPTSGTAPVPLPQQPGGTLPANYQTARDAFEKQRQEQIANDPFGRISAAVVGNDQFGQQFGYAADADAFDQFYNQNYGTPAPASDMAGGGTQMMPISGPGSPFEEYLDPSMAFRMKLGTQATERLANVGGGAISGNTMRALTDYGQNLASTEYGNAFNRFQTERGNIYNTLANIAGMGQSAVNTGVNAGQNFASTQTGLLTGQAAAQAAGTVGSANAYSGALGNVGNMAFLSSLMRPQAVAQQPTPTGPTTGQIYNPVAVA